MTKDEALERKAENARELGLNYEPEWTPERIAGMARLKEAQDKKLAQPEQEQLMSDQINYGMSVTQGGKRIDPMSIYKEPEHDKTDVRCECCGYMTYHREHLGCIRAAKLKEPEQEPVAWRAWVSKFPQGTGSDWVYVTKPIMKDRIHNQPLYTTPPQRKPLTDEQARFEFEAWHKDAYTQSLERYGHTYKNHHTRCRWQGWLAAHGIKGEA